MEGLIESQATENVLAAIALAVGLFSVWLSLYLNRSGTEREDRRISAELRREVHIRELATYMELEVHSSEVFKFAAERAVVMAPFRTHGPPPPNWETDEALEEARETTLNLFYQSLNLFEVCCRMRRHELFPDEVFASWVSWFYEILETWYFRALWTDLIRQNYTDDVRRIYDVGTDIFRYDLTEAERREAFYRAVGELMGCPAAAEWLSRLEDQKTWRETTSSRRFPTAGIRAPLSPAPSPISPAA